MLGAEMQATPDQISIYVADAGGEPASSAWIRYYPGRQFAELYGGATVPGQRGKGLYTALVKARAREARQRGVRFLVVDTSPMSRPVLEKLGFVLLTYSQPFVMEVTGPLTS
jgi:predicted GNAT family acetyltransferase